MLKFELVPVTHFQQNCSVVWCSETNQAALIDPGGEPERIMQVVERLKLTVVAIWLTHGHLDHVGASNALAKTLKVDVIGPHKDDEFWLKALPEQSKMMGFTAHDALAPTRWLNDGDTLSLGNLTFSVLHCPGHTPGHVVLFEPNSKMAFVGDVIFAGSVGRTDFPRSNSQQLIDSIREKLWPLGDDVKFVPGHGPMSTFGQERRVNPFVADARFG
ncbi:MBL fold metallo-hydrolase [Sessilibacter sp. MAH4]